MTSSRRHFLQQLGGAAMAAPFAGALGRLDAQPVATPFPFVDGLTFMGPPNEIAESGLSAFILDVSSVDRVPTTDGSIRYFRSFDACSRSIAAMRNTLQTSGGSAFLATKGSEITAAHRSGKTAVFFQFQGCEPIGEDLSKLEFFHAQGLRVLQISHHNNNAWGGGALEKTWTGLTKTGFDGVERMNALGIIPDLSHVGDASARDVLKTSRKTVIVSHGGARAIVNNARCTADDVIKGVANSGGAMGIFMMSFWLTNESTPTTDSYLRQLRHVINVGGIDAVGIANDYPIGGEANARRLGNDNSKAIGGYYAWWDSIAKEGVLGFDKRPTHVVIPELNNPRRAFLIMAALEKAGYKAGEIEKIMGGNWKRVLRENLG